MANAVRNRTSSTLRGLAWATLLVAGSFAACSKQPEAPQTAAAQKTFASPDAAGAALLEAAKSGSQDAMLAIFGPEGKDALFSGDAVKDKDNLQDFVAAYTQMHRWREIRAGGEMLYVGADNYPFPIPLGKRPSGQWEFDTAAGKDEILARRIGKDELIAITACGALAAAEQQYFSKTHNGDSTKQYAQRIVSETGKENGLYWPDSEGKSPSPLAAVGNFAKTAGYGNAGAQPQPFEGYYYRILTRQGAGAKGGAQDYLVNGKLVRGFAVVAYPTEYRASGIMTFIVAKDGVVYQKDLGDKTSAIGAAMDAYDPSEGWRPAL